MAVTCGFYNSLNHDRLYDATQISNIFDGIITDGVFESIGTSLMVTENSGMIVNVGIGRAWFNHTWTLNDAELPLEVEQSEVVLDRIDAVVLEVDATEAVRENTIKIIKGTPSSNPMAPSMVDDEYVHQHLLATIRVGAQVTEITQANIENFVGTSTTPFITAILQQTDVDGLLAQWRAQYAELIARDTAAFESWFANLQDQLDDNQAANLQNQIGNLNSLATPIKTDLVAAINSAGHPMLGTMEEVRANNEFGKVVDALAVKEIDSNLTWSQVILGSNSSPAVTDKTDVTQVGSAILDWLQNNTDFGLEARNFRFYVYDSSGTWVWMTELFNHTSSGHVYARMFSINPSTATLYRIQRIPGGADSVVPFKGTASIVTRSSSVYNVVSSTTLTCTPPESYSSFIGCYITYYRTVGSNHIGAEVKISSSNASSCTLSVVSVDGAKHTEATVTVIWIYIV